MKKDSLQSFWRTLSPLCLDPIKQKSSRNDMCATGKPLMTPLCRKDNEYVFLLSFFCSKFFIQLRSLLFPKFTHFTASYSALSTKLRWSCWGLCPLISPRDFCCLYFVVWSQSFLQKMINL